MSTTYYPDFSKLSQYDELSGVEAVRYAADTPLTEMDLNEMQLIQNAKRRLLTKQLFKDGFAPNGGSIKYTNGVLTITDKMAFVDGYMIYIDSASLPVAVGETAYLNVFEKQSVGPSDTLKKYGNENGVTIPNYIMDARYGQEITRRIVVAYELSTVQKNGASSIAIGTGISTGSGMIWLYNESVGARNYDSKDYLYANGREIPFSWTELVEKRIKGDFTGLEIGDFKSFQMEGELEGITVTMELAGMDVYEGYSTNNKHSLDFVTRDVVMKHRMCAANDTKTSGGHSAFGATELWSYLNTTIWNCLPSELREVITPKKILLETDKGAGSDGVSSAGWTWSDWSLWLLSDIELFGYQSWSQVGYGSGNFKHYPLYASESHIIKKLNGQPWWYWLIQPDCRNTTYWCGCRSNGTSGYTTASNAEGGVVFGFRI